MNRPISTDDPRSGNDLITVFDLTVCRVSNVDFISRRSGLPYNTLMRALGTLERNGLIRNTSRPGENAYYMARQTGCAVCDELLPPRERRVDDKIVRIHECKIDPETLRWHCTSCWETEVELVREIVGV